jgi:hypothetical protein
MKAVSGRDFARRLNVARQDYEARYGKSER